MIATKSPSLQKFTMIFFTLKYQRSKDKVIQVILQQRLLLLWEKIFRILIFNSYILFRRVYFKKFTLNKAKTLCIIMMITDIQLKYFCILNFGINYIKTNYSGSNNVMIFSEIHIDYLDNMKMNLSKSHADPIKNGKRTGTDIFPKKTYMWPTNI